MDARAFQAARQRLPAQPGRGLSFVDGTRLVLAGRYRARAIATFDAALARAFAHRAPDGKALARAARCRDMAAKAAQGSAFWGTLDGARGRFFAVLHTTPRTQVAAMTVPAGQEAGPPEVHAGEDQVFLFVEGEAEVRVWERGPAAPPAERRARAGDILVVPAGVQHWVRSSGGGPLFFFTVYGPPAY